MLRDEHTDSLSLSLFVADTTWSGLFSEPEGARLAELLPTVHVHAPGCEPEAAPWDRPYEPATPTLTHTHADMHTHTETHTCTHRHKSMCVCVRPHPVLVLIQLAF
jgi:hypothetical protein